MSCREQKALGRVPIATGYVEWVQGGSLSWDVAPHKWLVRRGRSQGGIAADALWVEPWVAEIANGFALASPAAYRLASGRFRKAVLEKLKALPDPAAAWAPYEASIRLGAAREQVFKDFVRRRVRSKS
jgi:hypothetical protein